MKHSIAHKLNTLAQLIETTFEPLSDFIDDQGKARDTKEFFEAIDSILDEFPERLAEINIQWDRTTENVNNWLEVLNQ